VQMAHLSNQALDQKQGKATEQRPHLFAASNSQRCASLSVQVDSRTRQPAETQLSAATHRLGLL
jgi:hypothetical protein